jgi:predicted flap endonuclease-1-like 5' DNA nuclease
MLLLSFCSFPWWLLWLLPFLLGLLAGWGIWSKYKSMVSDLEGEINSLRKKISSLEEDLAACQSRRADVESELALVKGRIREMEADIKTRSLESDASSGASGKGKPSGASGIDAGALSSSFAAGAAIGGGKKEVISTKKSSGGGGKNIYAALKHDNLQVIEGVGPKMESVLKEKNVKTHSDVAGKSADQLRVLLDSYGDKYRIIDPTTWPQQASLAARGEWDDLIALQKKLDTGRSDKATGTTDSKVEKLLIKMGVLKKWQQDDLKAVEGIGPKIAGLLEADGIKTWRALSEASVERIQKILDAAGPRYKLADPGTWPKQAGMAADGKWDELREYQDFLQGGKE